MIGELGFGAPTLKVQYWDGHQATSSQDCERTGRMNMEENSLIYTTEKQKVSPSPIDKPRAA